MIAAIEKAERLYNFAKAQGAQINTFQLTVTLPEAFELLDHFAEQIEEKTLFDADVALAKLEQNPWTVLSHFTLMGFHIVPLMALH